MPMGSLLHITFIHFFFVSWIKLWPIPRLRGEWDKQHFQYFWLNFSFKNYQLRISGSSSATYTTLSECLTYLLSIAHETISVQGEWTSLVSKLFWDASLYRQSPSQTGFEKNPYTHTQLTVKKSITMAQKTCK